MTCTSMVQNCLYLFHFEQNKFSYESPIFTNVKNLFCFNHTYLNFLNFQKEISKKATPKAILLIGKQGIRYTAGRKGILNLFFYFSLW